MLLILKRIATAAMLTLFATVAVAQSQYKARPGDTLAIEVLEDSSLNRTVVVLPDGRFSFPFAGSLRASGQTVGQIENTISTAIASNFAATPNVFVSLQPKPRELANSGAPAPSGPTIDVYFLGEVTRPGLVEMKPGTTLLQAIAVGGGMSRFAAVKRVQLRRIDPNTNTQTVTTINYKALSNGAASKDIELRDGDVILVPERRLFE